MLPFFIDAHVHLNKFSQCLEQLAIRHNSFFVSINTDIPFFPSLEDQQRLSQEYNKAQNVSTFITSFRAEGIGTDKWASNAIKKIEKGLENGARGVKIWKNFGMDPDLKDSNGDFITIDHPLLKPVLDYIERNGILLIGHQGEPRNCWLPLDEMTVDSDREYFTLHPEHHMFLHHEYLSYESQIEARDTMLKRHPNLRYVGLHLFSLEWDLDEVAKRLDQFPNTMTDLAERICHVQLQAMQNHAKVRQFFIDYQDRIIYGTDLINDVTQTEEAVCNRLETLWKNHYNFFATDIAMTAVEFQGTFNGLNLPKEVLQKIYVDNAIKTYQLQNLIATRLNQVI